jgi:TRAP-type transport system small permease protein
MKRVPVALEEGLAVACMVLLVVITLLNVVTRYFTDQSFAWTEELSVFLMVVMTLAGASAAAARDRHIRVEYFYDSGTGVAGKARRRQLKVVGACITALLFVVLAVLFGRVMADELKYGETSQGLGLPRWWFTAFSLLLCVAVALRAAGVAWAAAQETVAQEPVAQETVAQEPVAQEPVAQEPVAQETTATPPP